MFQSLLNNLTGLRVRGDLLKARQSREDKARLLLSAGEILSVKDNTPVLDTELAANQAVLIYSDPQLIPIKKHIIVSYNPKLVEDGCQVTIISSIISPGEEAKLGLLLRPLKKINLTDYDHLIRVYLL